MIEADESDGSLVRYRPWCGVVLNLGLDHKAPAEVLAMFRTFRAAHHRTLRAGGRAQPGRRWPPARCASAWRTSTPAPRASSPPTSDLEPDRVRFTVDGTVFTVPQPGRHTVLNACAAVAAARAAGVRTTRRPPPPWPTSAAWPAASSPWAPPAASR